MFNNPETRRATLLGLGLVALTLCCCAITILGWTRGALRAFDTTARHQSEVRAPLRDATTLFVGHERGSVVVRGDASDEIVVEVVSAAPTQAEAEAVRATLSQEAEEIRLVLEGITSDGVRVDLLIHVPPNLALRLNNRVGNLTVESVHGPLDIQSGASMVTVRDHAADGPLRIVASTGEVRVALASMEANSQLDITVEVGSLTVELPDNIGFEADMSTQVGSIVVGGFSVEGLSDAQAGTGQARRGPIAPTDGRSVTLRVQTGDIVLRAR